MSIKRIYDEPASSDGYRVLVDRLWPRGISKEKAALDVWLKDIAPSVELRKWFGHKPERFQDFRKRYEAELDMNPALTQLREIIRQHTEVTLLFAAHDPRLNQAAALRDYLSR